MTGQYVVRIPICGYAEISVEANSDEEALQLALDLSDQSHIQEIYFLQDVMSLGRYVGPLEQAEVQYVGEVFDALD